MARQTDGYALPAALIGVPVVVMGWRRVAASDAARSVAIRVRAVGLDFAIYVRCLPIWILWE